MDTDTHAPRDTRDVRVAQSLLRLGARVVVSATLPLSDLIALAQQAAERDTMLTLRGASERSSADLERVAMAGRGHVTFDLSV
ncbi:MAG: hypothetical protein IPG84_17345 [Betaproteobacteria bacterium]|jgi:hypothetical protein|nr:hypothetical protein [Betaproteobacteria bacterium]